MNARLLGLCLALGCSANAESLTLSVPPAEGFAPVSSALGARCGSLDCHGRAEQNMRLYGELGLRLADGDVPGGEETTDDEHEANYRSVVTLEPELLSAVWLATGQGSGGLSLLRKARGQESHVGGAVFPVNDPGERCLLSWLSGSTDTAACEVAQEPPASPFEDTADAP